MAGATYDMLRVERVTLGQPAAETAAAEMQRIGAERALIVSSGSLARDTSEVEKIQKALGSKAAGLFTNCRAHSPQDDALSVADAARAADADVFVTVGGGTVIDTTKVAQLCLTENVRDLETLGHYALGRAGTDEMKTCGPIQARQIAIPTTLSAAEFTALGGATNIETRVKEAFVAPDMVARVVIYDPALCTHTPIDLWLSTGIRSVDHAVEGYCAKAASPAIKGSFVQSLKMLAQSLRATVADPSDLSARVTSQEALWLGSMGRSYVTMGASHGIGYILGGAFGVPHGVTSCVMLPAVVEWNADAIGKEGRSELAQALGGSTSDDPADLLRRLMQDLKQPHTLSAVGIKDSDWQKIADMAMQNFVVLSNPRPVTGPDDIFEILNIAA